MKRLTAAGLLAATTIAIACNSGDEPALELTVTGKGTPARVAIVRSVDGRDTSDTIRLYTRSYQASFVVVQITAATGTVDCRISYDGEVVARDEDARPGTASCSAEVPGGAR